MAKAKKKAALSLEERLKQALVPEAEQPYPVPENWCWTKIKSISDVVTGGTPSKKNPEYYGGHFPFFKPADLDSGRHTCIASEYLSDKGKNVARLIPANSTAVCCIGTIGKCGYLVIDGTTNQQINSAIPKINSLYLYYFCNTSDFINQLLEKSSSTTISIVNKSKMEECGIPLAPLSEQQHIVDRIESLFAKLDEAKEKAQAALDSFETRKAAILHKAFTGELTAKWREKNGIGMDSWKLETLAETCYSVFDGDHMPPPKAEAGVPFLVISNVNNGYISFENTRFVSQQYYDNLTATRRPQIHDVLYTLVGSYGIPVLVDTDKPFCFQRHMALLKPIPQKINSKLLWYQLKSELFYQKATEISTGTAQLTVPIKGLRQLKLFIPKIDEQFEIVRILDDFFAKEQKAKVLCSVLDKIHLIKKSILSRAFRGELGTNDPTEESALNLLKSIV